MTKVTSLPLLKTLKLVLMANYSDRKDLLQIAISKKKNLLELTSE